MKLLYTFVLLFLASKVNAQVIVTRDPVITGMLDEVSAANLEASVRKLVSFHTRHTLSDTTSKTRGIGAARSWIKAEFERYNKDNGGKLQVEYDSFVQPADGRRVQAPTVLKNVMAILPEQTLLTKEC